MTGNFLKNNVLLCLYFLKNNFFSNHIPCDSKRFIDFKTQYIAFALSVCIIFAYPNLRARIESLKPCIQLFIPIVRKFFGSIFFQNKSQRRGIPQRLLDKYSHVLICISLKQTLTNGQKPVYTVKILISEQIAFAAVVYFGQVFVFCRLINKSVLEWFLLIMCK